MDIIRIEQLLCYWNCLFFELVLHIMRYTKWVIAQNTHRSLYAIYMLFVLTSIHNLKITGHIWTFCILNAILYIIEDIPCVLLELHERPNCRAMAPDAFWYNVVMCILQSMTYIYVANIHSPSYLKGVHCTLLRVYSHWLSSIEGQSY